MNQFFSQWLGVNQPIEPSVYIPQQKTHPSVKEEPIKKTEKLALLWKKNQPVQHTKYGVGTIQDVEEKSSGDTYLTVKFKLTVKKILAQFLQKL
jgi:hypothetical protein